MDASAPYLAPGSKMVVQVGDELIEDTVHTVRYTSAKAEIRQQPTGWRRIVWSLTPTRWRKPLPIIRPYQPAGVEIVPASDHVRRAQLAAERTGRALDALLQR